MIDSDKHMDTDREKMSRAKYEEMFMGEKGSNICGFDMNRFTFLFYFGCNNFMCPKIENGGRFSDQFKICLEEKYIYHEVHLLMVHLN